MIYMACCCGDDDDDGGGGNPPIACDGEAVCEFKYYVVEGSASVLYSHTKSYSEQLSFQGSASCNDQCTGFEIETERGDVVTASAFASLSFKVIMQSNGFGPGFPAEAELTVVGGYKLVRSANAGKSGSYSFDTSSYRNRPCPPPNTATTSKSTGWEYSTSGQEGGDGQFSLTAEISYSECPTGIQTPCFADLPSGCYEVWSFSGGVRVFGESITHFARESGSFNIEPDPPDDY